MSDADEAGPPDDRPPICPACGVTQGLQLGDDGEPRFVCLECGFGEDEEATPRGREVSGPRRRLYG